ncbi:hypothetical protein CDD81_4025 [Ophiocordyceps australis]|uniref:Uncharacterized protein n=1 Tax=Ophiocordyceps australis TaxID=1399860 RepID=A0A2C5YAX0_9HYPO|nr:hypothetical protein CDD81_4025 [Ophiocordyceps australis]
MSSPHDVKEAEPPQADVEISQGDEHHDISMVDWLPPHEIIEAPFSDTHFDTEAIIVPSDLETVNLFDSDIIDAPIDPQLAGASSSEAVQEDKATDWPQQPERTGEMVAQLTQTLVGSPDPAQAAIDISNSYPKSIQEGIAAWKSNDVFRLDPPQILFANAFGNRTNEKLSIDALLHRSLSNPDSIVVSNAVEAESFESLPVNQAPYGVPRKRSSKRAYAFTYSSPPSSELSSFPGDTLQHNESGMVGTIPGSNPNPAPSTVPDLFIEGRACGPPDFLRRAMIADIPPPSDPKYLGPEQANNYAKDMKKRRKERRRQMKIKRRSFLVNDYLNKSAQDANLVSADESPASPPDESSPSSFGEPTDSCSPSSPDISCEVSPSASPDKTRSSPSFSMRKFLENYAGFKNDSSLLEPLPPGLESSKPGEKTKWDQSAAGSSILDRMDLIEASLVPRPHTTAENQRPEEAFGFMVGEEGREEENEQDEEYEEDEYEEEGDEEYEDDEYEDAEREEYEDAQGEEHGDEKNRIIILRPPGAWRESNAPEPEARRMRRVRKEAGIWACTRCEITLHLEYMRLPTPEGSHAFRQRECHHCGRLKFCGLSAELEV